MEYAIEVLHIRKVKKIGDLNKLERANQLESISLDTYTRSKKMLTVEIESLKRAISMLRD